MRFLAVLVLFSIIMSLSGCWDYVELDELALVLLMGFDLDPAGDGFEVTVHLLNIAAGNGASGTEQTGSSSQTVTYTATGQTISDATRNLRGRVPGEFSFHHVRVILIGEELARKGIAPVLDLLIRAPEIRIISNLLICQGTAREVMMAAPEISESLEQELRGQILAQEEWSKGYSPELAEFVRNYLDRSAQPVAGRVFLNVFRTPLQSGQDEQQTSQASTIIEGLAVFRDDQLVDWLTGTETIGYRYITGQGGTMALVVPWHAGLVTIELVPEFSRMEYISGSDPPGFRNTVHITGEIIEYTGAIEFTAPILNQLESVAAETVQDLLANTDRRARELNSDFLGYGAAISRQDPQRWQVLNKNWREIFPATQTDFVVNFNLKHTGATRKPPTR